MKKMLYLVVGMVGVWAMMNIMAPMSTLAWTMVDENGITWMDLRDAYMTKDKRFDWIKTSEKKRITAINPRKNSIRFWWDSDYGHIVFPNIRFSLWAFPDGLKDYFYKYTDDGPLRRALLIEMTFEKSKEVFRDRTETTLGPEFMSNKIRGYYPGQAVIVMGVQTEYDSGQLYVDYRECANDPAMEKEGMECQIIYSEDYDYENMKCLEKIGEGENENCMMWDYPAGDYYVAKYVPMPEVKPGEEFDYEKEKAMLAVGGEGESNSSEEAGSESGESGVNGGGETANGGGTSGGDGGGSSNGGGGNGGDGSGANPVVAGVTERGLEGQGRVKALSTAQVDEKKAEEGRDGNRAENGGEVDRVETGQVEVPLTGCQERKEFPWWLIAMLVAGDVLVMWWFWPNRQVEKK